MSFLTVTNVLLALGFLSAVMLIIVIVNLRRVVPTNMVHIIQAKNNTISYGKGRKDGNVYYEWPSWIPVIGVTVSRFSESVFSIALEDYDAYDEGRLPFVVDVKAFFRIADSNMAAQRVSTFEELKTQLRDILQGAVRRVLAKDKLENIMEDRAGLGIRFTEEVTSQLLEWGVTTVKSIEFMDLRDSDGSKVIENIMAKEKSRIDKESRIVVAENKREAELKEIDAKRVVDVQRQDAEQQVGIRTAEKDKVVGIANEQAEQEIKVQAKVTAEKDMAVIQVKQVKAAEIQKEVAKVAADQDKEVRTIKAEGDKQVLITTAEGDKANTITTAEGDLEAAKLNAEGIQAEGIAKGVAEKAMLMAPVDTQITLAKEIGSNEGYQNYLITIKKVEVSKDVGIEMAKAMQNADLKVIANSGDINSGVAKIGDMFTPAGGTNLTGMLAALAQSSEGKALLDKFIGKTE